jgi:hypothetical protein
MIDTTNLLTIKEASEWASNYTGKDVTPSNIRTRQYEIEEI